jgi:hypothetical protein
MSSSVTPLKRSALEAGFDSPRKDEEPVDEVKGVASVPKISKARACMQTAIIMMSRNKLTDCF